MSAEPDGHIPAIALRVREHRRRRGLSQVQVATGVGRSPMWVDRLEHGDLEWIPRLENGLVEPSEIPVLTDLASVLGVRLADLVGPGVVMFAPAPPRPARRTLVVPRPPARTVAVGVAVAIATAAAGLGLARAHAAATAANPHGHPASASARLGPPPPVAASAQETAAAGPEESGTPGDAPTVEPAIPPTASPTAPPAPPTHRPGPVHTATPRPVPTARVAVATPLPHPPAGVSVFPWALSASVSAGNEAPGYVLTFTVTNPGDVAETLGAVSLGNQAAHVVRDDCGHAALAPGAHCQVSVRIGSAKPGHYTGPLVVPVDGARATTVPIEIDVR